MIDPREPLRVEWRVPRRPQILPQAAACLVPRARYDARFPGLGGTGMADPLVGIVMGSQSDWPTMEGAANVLDELGVAYETRILSAHRTPDRMFAYAEAAASRGLRAIIAGAGGAAHLPGMLAAKTRVPVLGVPVKGWALDGLDSLCSIVQMPRGIPVATFAIGAVGAMNAGLFAAAQIATTDPDLASRLETWRAARTAAVAEEPERG